MWRELVERGVASRLDEVERCAESVLEGRGSVDDGHCASRVSGSMLVETWLVESEGIIALIGNEYYSVRRQTRGIIS